MTTIQSEKENIRESVSRAFPLPGTNLYKLISDPAFKKVFHARVKQGNRWLIPLYKLGILPLLGLGKQIMLLTTKDRKSHQMRDTPIGYFRLDDSIYVFSGWGKEANWYKNMVVCPEEVYVQIGFRRFEARPEVVEDPQELKQVIERLILQDPKVARMLMGWDVKCDHLETADFSLMIEKVLVVRFHLR
jgi:deazaflavin-dependent oxidoreductase (nitroreductase family)